MYGKSKQHDTSETIEFFGDGCRTKNIYFFYEIIDMRDEPAQPGLTQLHWNTSTGYF